MTWRAISTRPYVGALEHPPSLVTSPKQHSPFGSNQRGEMSDDLSEELGGLNGLAAAVSSTDMSGLSGLSGVTAAVSRSNTKELEDERKELEELSPEVGPARCCSPRHRMPFSSRNEGLKCVSMTWRAISGRP